MIVTENAEHFVYGKALSLRQEWLFLCMHDVVDEDCDEMFMSLLNVPVFPHYFTQEKLKYVYKSRKGTDQS